MARFDYAAARYNAQRVAHDTLSVEARYVPPSGGSNVVLRIRRRNKQILDGNLMGEGYAQIIEGASSLVFDSDELDQKQIVLERGGSVTLADGSVLILDSHMPNVGPVATVWRVMQE